MIAIVDSGSTKSDWVIINNDGSEVLRTKTIGFNPHFIKTPAIEAELHSNDDLMKISDELTNIFFYGAGCSSKEFNAVVEKALQRVFDSSKVIVDHDLLAAAYSTYSGHPQITCILGTGSNSCFFDGEILREESPSLGYILGDEGSGNALGKRIVRAYFLNKMPQNLKRAFKERYNLTLNELIKGVYIKKLPNKYLASFSRFVSDHKQDPFVQNIIHGCMEDFFINQIMQYPEARTCEINFIGSVAFHYVDTLKSVASRHHMRIGNIIQKPIDNLVKYHIMYILPKVL